MVALRAGWVDGNQVVVVGRGMRIGDVATLLGISERQILRYEEAGLIDKVPRSHAGQRRYLPKHVSQIVRASRKLSDAGVVVKIMEEPTLKHMTIGDVVRRYWTDTRTLHRLEASGVLPPLPRDSNGNRIFTARELRILDTHFFKGEPGPKPSWVKADVVEPPRQRLTSKKR